MTQGPTKGIPLDTDGTLAANSDQLVATQKATKTYADTKLASSLVSAFMVTVLDDTTAATARATLGIAAAVGGVEWTSVVKVSDESVSSSTVLQDDDELFFTATSGKIYEWEMSLIYVSTAGAGTPDLKWAAGEDATARGTHLTTSVITAGETIGTGASLTNLSATGAPGTAAALRMFRVMGSHLGNGGSFKLQWAQNTSDANATTVKAGSILRYRKLN